MPSFPRNYAINDYVGSRHVTRQTKNGNVYKGPPPFPSMSYSTSRYQLTGWKNAVADNGKPSRGILELYAYGERAKFLNRIRDAAYKKAYDKFYSAIGDSAEMGLLVAERREALGLMATRASTLVKAYKSLRKGRFGDFIKALDTRPVKRHQRTKWTRPKDASALWLEYWFGWSPLVADISSVVDVLQGDIPFGQRLRGRGRGKTIHRFQQSGSIAVSSISDATARCQLLGTVRVTNNDLYLANQLGFVNPAYVAWQLVPFSFLADWFVPIGDFLQSFTNNVGLEIKDVWISYKTDVHVTETVTRITGVAEYTADYHDFSRVQSSTVPRPELVFAVPDRLSITRAATAISLCVALFTKG